VDGGATAQLVRAAWLYYEADRTQDEIARELGVPRPRVSRLLQQARADGIVQIKVVDPRGDDDRLAAALRARFDLAVALVVPAAGWSSALLRAAIADRAVQYFRETARPGDVVGIGRGATIAAMVAALERQPRPIGCRWVPLTGGLGHTRQPNELSRRLAHALGGVALDLPAPAWLSTRAAYDDLLAQPQIREVASVWETVRLALVGIGARDSFRDHRPPDETERLLRAGAVGEILGQHFTIDGDLSHEPGQVIAMSLANLRQRPKAIALGGGPDKAEAILGALRGRFVSGLVTDAEAAARLLELAGTPRAARRGQMSARASEVVGAGR
jgi:DNA-binding transcriptional regulator LsrR (DeoR family)